MLCPVQCLRHWFPCRLTPPFVNVFLMHGYFPRTGLPLASHMLQGFSCLYCCCLRSRISFLQVIAFYEPLCFVKGCSEGLPWIWTGRLRVPPSGVMGNPEDNVVGHSATGDWPWQDRVYLGFALDQNAMGSSHGVQLLVCNGVWSSSNGPIEV